MIVSWILLIFLTSFPTLVEAGPLYKYKNNEGVVTLTDNLESIPKNLRNQIEIIQQEAKDTVDETESPQKSRDQVIIQGLLVIIGMLSLLCFKLWVKNFIFKFIARILMVVAFIGLLYLIVHYLFLSPGDHRFLPSLPQAVQKQIEPYTAPIEKAKEGILLFKKGQKEKQKDLDSIR